MRLVRAAGGVTWQGPARRGRRRYGVPPGGAFDRESMLLANRLCGVDASQTVLEITLFEAELQVETGVLAIVGASSPIVEGARVVLPMPASGCRTYVAWSGAAEIPHGQVAGADEQWTADPQLQPLRIPTLPEHLRPDSLRARPLRVMEGPQWELLDSAQLLRTAFRTTPRMDRVGIRLDGPSLGVAPEIVSEPATFGSIQATSSGELVILGPDGPTIGGYPKVATVIDADLDRLGQLRPGDEVTFELVDMERARELRIERCRRLHRLLED